jgi:hypothetical protein
MWTWQRANNPMTQMRTVWADFNTELIELGQDILPPVVTGMRMLDQALKGIKEIFSLPENVSVHADGGAYWQHVKDAVGGLFGYGGGSPTYSSGGIGPSGLGPGSGGRGGGAVGASLAANQQEAYRAAIASGMSDSAARILVGNMSGEALSDPANVHWDRSHYAHGIVQWDDARSQRILAHFGKSPQDMTVAEQTRAAAWEMQTYYPDTWSALNNDKASDKDRMWSVVKGYENPADPGGATNTRLGFLARFHPAAAADKAASPLAPSTADKAASSPAPVTSTRRGNAATYDTLMDEAYKNQKGDDMDPSTHAHAKEHVTNVTLNVDGKKVAQVVQKHIVRRNQYVFGPSGYDGAAMPSGVDHGMAAAVSA